MAIKETTDEFIVDIVLTKEMVQDYDNTKEFKPYETIKAAARKQWLDIVLEHPKTESGAVEDNKTVFGHVDTIIADDKTKEVRGKGHFYKSTTPKEIQKLLKKRLPIEGSIGGFADFSGSNITSLGSLEYIGGKADFEGSNVTSLGSLKSIDGSAYFEGSKITSLGSLEHIGGKAYFDDSQIKLKKEYERRFGK